MSQPKHIAILGTGPTGLEAALAAAEAGHDFTLYEAAEEVAGHVADWAHVRLFTPWDLNVSPRAQRALVAAGLEVPWGPSCPTGGELRERLLVPLSQLPAIAARLRLGTRVKGVAREGLLKHEEIASAARASHPFRILVEAQGRERIDRADVVLDTTGSYSVPNTLGDGGIPAPGESSLGTAIEHRIPDLGRDGGRYAGRTTLLVGAGHSAQTAVRDLAALAEREPGTRVIWVLRSGPPHLAASDDPLTERVALSRAAEGFALGASPAVVPLLGMVVDRIDRDGGRLAITLRRKDGSTETVEADRVLALTGAVGDHTLYRQLQIHECYATSGPMKLAAALLGAAGGDCLAQTSHGADTLKNPEPGFFVLGAKSYGRNNNFLLRIGWSQVEEVMGLV
jgi:thioredoxin reductase